jgi:hypothetical protein
VFGGITVQSQDIFFRGHLPEKPLILALKERWLSVRQSI